MKKFYKLLPLIFLLIFNTFSLFTLFKIKSISTGASSAFAKLAITVLTEDTLSPIDNAQICILETHEYYPTNKNGLSPIIKVPIIQNQNLNNIKNQNWGEITILVYKPGFADNISFYNFVPINQTKLGHIIKLRPIYSENDTSPTITATPPNKDWVNQVINQYKK